MMDSIIDEARQLRVLIDKEAMDALDKGNFGVIRFIVNRIRRIRKCVAAATLARVIQGDGIAIEQALRALLLYP